MSDSAQTTFPPWLIALAGLGGGFAGSQPTPTSTSGSGTTSGTSYSAGNTDLSSSQQLLNLLNTLQHISGQSSTTQTSSPNLNPQSQQFISQLMERYRNLTAPNLTGYEAGQTANINNNAELQKRAVANIMASRGLSTSPVAGTSEANIESNRIGQITGLQQQIPLLQNQYNLQNLSGAAGFAGILPGLFGSTLTGAGTTAQTQSATQQQNQFNTQQGQTSTNTASGQNQATQQQQQTKQGGGLGGLVSGALSAVLPLLLMSDKRLKKDISPVEKAIQKVRELKPVTWKWKGGETEDSGFVAQDIEKLLPHLVHIDKSAGVELKKVNYAGIIPLLVGAVQDLDKRVGA